MAKPPKSLLALYQLSNQKSKVKIASFFLPSQLYIQDPGHTANAYSWSFLQVIHLCLTPETAQIEIPAILKNEPVTTDIELGSKNYENVPRAIVVGGGYDDADIDAMRKACQAVKTPLVPWLRVGIYTLPYFLLSASG